MSKWEGTKYPSKEQFLKSIKDHEMIIMHDEGIYRHLRFKKPNTMCYCFDLTTWPGYLTISGDMGCFCFSRTEDMFYFFDNDKRPDLEINPYYWSEKVESSPYEEKPVKVFDIDVFRNDFKKAFIDYELEEIEEDEDKSVKQSDLFEMYSDILTAEDEYEVVHEVRNFQYHNGYAIDWECIPSGKIWAYHYIWCCYAIQWGIIQYKNSNKMIKE
jgi:hypothetical protein